MPAVVTEPGLAGKVAFLSDPASYPQPNRGVAAVETHMSWVFLTDTHAWKLKKPRRVDGIDLSRPELRRRHCELELRLNRRFSPDVYLGAVALCAAPDGRLALGGGGRAVDWLLQMRRLPESLMLDRMIRDGTMRPRDARLLAAELGRFYLACAPEPIDGAAFRARLAARIRANARELRGYAHVVSARLSEDLCERQESFLHLEAGLFDARAEAGRVVEGHGDLRPEHVCMEPEPRVIDCLEFDRALRIVDAAEELGFLALECERLGAPQLRDVLFDSYEEAAGDAPDARLVHFYQSVHACTRAWLALHHLRDQPPRDPARWPLVAGVYLRLAEDHLALCSTPKL